MDPPMAVNAHKWRRVGSKCSPEWSVNQWSQIRIIFLYEESEKGDPDPH